VDSLAVHAASVAVFVCHGDDRSVKGGIWEVWICAFGWTLRWEGTGRAFVISIDSYPVWPMTYVSGHGDHGKATNGSVSSARIEVYVCVLA
jgi:hypothetical protein